MIAVRGVEIVRIIVPRRTNDDIVKPIPVDIAEPADRVTEGITMVSSPTQTMTDVVGSMPGRSERRLGAAPGARGASGPA